MSEQDFGDEIVPEDWPTVFTQIPVWLLLSGSTAQAYRMYAFLAEHINSRLTGKDRIAFPSMKAIARALGLKDHRDVKKYREELERLGAVRAELAPYAGGLRRRYKYWVRFNPPAAYTGPTSLSEFYEINDDVRSKKNTAGQPQGGKKPTLEGGENPTLRERKNPTLKKRDQEQPDQPERDDAPSARSAADGRRPSTGSRGSRGGGSAASGKTKPSFSREQRRQYDAFVQALPVPLAALAPRGLPRELVNAVLTATDLESPAGRTVQQLVEYRLTPKWDRYYGSLEQAGPIEKPVGVLVAMLRRDAECSDPRCDERTNVDTGLPCISCEQRGVDKRAERAQEAVREAAPEAAAAPRPQRASKPARVPAQPAGGAGGEWAPPNNEYRAIRAMTVGQRRHR